MNVKQHTADVCKGIIIHLKIVLAIIFIALTIGIASL